MTANVDFSHLNALELGLSHERAHLAAAKSEGEREIRAVWVAQREREIAAEYKFLGLTPFDASDLSDDEILAELSR